MQIGGNVKGKKISLKVGKMLGRITIYDDMTVRFGSGLRNIPGSQCGYIVNTIKAVLTPKKIENSVKLELKKGDVEVKQLRQ